MSTELKTTKVYKIDPSKGKGGSIVTTDEDGHVISSLTIEEAMANQSRELLTPIVDGLIYPAASGWWQRRQRRAKPIWALCSPTNSQAGKTILGTE